MAYTTVEALRARMRDFSTDDEPMYQAAIDAAAEVIDNYCDQSFVAAGTVATARTFTASGYGSVDVDAFASGTGLVVVADCDFDGTFEVDFPLANLLLLPLNAPSRGRPYNEIAVQPWASQLFPLFYGALRVTAPWGWPATPTSVVEANLIQAQRFARRRDAPFGLLESQLSGTQERLWSMIDADAEVLLRNYRKTNFGVGGRP